MTRKLTEQPQNKVQVQVVEARQNGKYRYYISQVLSLLSHQHDTDHFSHPKRNPLLPVFSPLLPSLSNFRISSTFPSTASILFCTGDF
jgi:hypothetical protein